MAPSTMVGPVAVVPLTTVMPVAAASQVGEAERRVGEGGVEVVVEVMAVVAVVGLLAEAVVGTTATALQLVGPTVVAVGPMAVAVSVAMVVVVVVPPPQRLQQLLRQCQRQHWQRRQRRQEWVRHLQPPA
jgi:hypothetical protein